MKMLRCLLLAAVACAAAAMQNLGSQQLLDLAKAEPKQAFETWATQSNKEYKTDVLREQAYGAFLGNVRFIEEQQRLNPQLVLALNEFADMTWEQFSAQKLGFKPDMKSQLKSAAIPGFMYEHTDAPDAVDWRTKGAVTDVKNQGQCGSCWAFSTTGSIEGINAIVTGELVRLSEQELVDCDTEKDMGCNGGLMNYAFEYITKNGGIDTEEDYQYWSSWGMSFWGCNKRKEKDRPAVSIEGYQEVPQDEASLIKAAANQPIAVGICASAALQFYSSGILDKCCDGLNHGVLVVGFGSDDKGGGYYIVKNSWGAGWGEHGYFRLRVKGGGKYGLCGISQAASFPVKTKPNKPVPLMCDMFGWTECPVKNTCSCSFSFFGLVCLWHDCCPLEHGVTCSDLQHCCPQGTVCDGKQQACVYEDGSKPSVPWTPKAKAKESGPVPQQVVEAREKQEQASSAAHVTTLAHGQDAKAQASRKVAPQ